MEKFKQILKSRGFWAIVGSIALMAAISLIYFYPDDIEGNVLQQHDTRQGLAIGHEAQEFTKETGEATRWTNSLFGGMPTFQIAPSYPSNALFGWIQTTLSLGLPFPASILFLMMLGFFILLMTMKLRWYVSLIGAIAYGFSSYFIIIIGAGHIWKFITLAFIPPTIAGVVLAYRGRYLSGAAMTALFGMLQISSNHIQMTYYFLFVVLGMVIAYLIGAIREKRLKRWAIATCVLAAAGALAVAANLPNLYNTYEYSKETMRGGHSELKKNADGNNQDTNTSTGGLNRDYLTQYSYGTSETFTLLIPNVKGGATILPMKGSNKFLSLGELEKAQEMAYSGDISPETAYYLQQIPQYFGEPEPTNGPVYVGALIAALFLVGCVIVRGPLKWVLIALTIFSILLALGRNCMWLTNIMIDYVPLYNKFRTPESILVIAEFTMPLLAALSLQKLLSGDAREAWERYGRTILWCFGAVLTICLAGMIMPGIFGNVITEGEKAAGINQMPDLYQAIEQLRYNMIRTDAIRSFTIVAFGLGVLMLYFRKIVSVGVAALGVAVIVVGDLFSINKRYLNTDCFMPAPLSTDEVFALSPADEAILADTTMNYRVMDIQRFSSADPSYYHKAIGGYHAAKLTRYQDILDYYFSGERDYLNILNMLNAKYIIQDPSQQPLVNPEAMGNAWLVDHIKYVATPDEEIAAIGDIDLSSKAVADKKFEKVLGQSRPKTAGDTIFETSYAPNRLTYHVNTANGGVAVFSEVYFPWGWEATIDGKPAELGRTNYILRALNIPSGSHTIEMQFDPKSIKTTTSAAYAAIITIYILLIAAGSVALFKKPGEDDNDNKEKAAEPAAKVED